MTQRITYLGSQVYPKQQIKRDMRGRYSVRSSLKYHYRRFMSWLLKWTKRVAFVALVVGFLFGSYYLGTVNAKEITATNILVAAAPAKTAPVMERIATAESKGHQYGTSGQVLIHVNSNGTVDLGKYQINSIWFATATKLGYDLTKEKDNEAFAMYLYAEKGTSPWASSSANWN